MALQVNSWGMSEKYSVLQVSCKNYSQMGEDIEWSYFWISIIITEYAFLHLDEFQWQWHSTVSKNHKSSYNLCEADRIV